MSFELRIRARLVERAQAAIRAAARIRDRVERQDYERDARHASALALALAGLEKALRDAPDPQAFLEAAERLATQAEAAEAALGIVEGRAPAAASGSPGSADPDASVDSQATLA